MTAVYFKAPGKKKYLKTPTQQTKYPTLKKPIQTNKNKIISKSNSQQARQEKKKKRKPYSLLIHKHGPYTTGI